MTRKAATLVLSAILMTSALATVVSVIPTPAEARGGRGEIGRAHV